VNNVLKLYDKLHSFLLTFETLKVTFSIYVLFDFTMYTYSGFVYIVQTRRV